MKLVLHAGMHKTGSSSIQKSFATYDRGGVAYLQVGHPNHSGLHFTAFAKAPHRYRAHVKNKRSEEEVAALRARFRERITAACLAARERGVHTLLSSGEDLSVLRRPGLRELRDFFAPLVSEIEIIAYLRPPASFMRSALQQRVVGGQGCKLADLYPQYRSRFEKFDEIFGAAAVTLIKFDRAQLHEGDVTLDFARRVGADMGREEVAHMNESRSLEATALLFAQRRLGRGMESYPGAPQDNQRLVQSLSRIGEGRIHLSPEGLAPILEAHRADLDWVSARLGQPFADAPEPHPQAIGAPRELLDIAAGQMPALMRRIAEETPDLPVEPELVARAVDLLHDILRNARTRRAQGGAKPDRAG